MTTEIDADRFATIIKHTAESCDKLGRLVWISDLWHGVEDIPWIAELSLDEFKTALVICHQLGKLELGRNDWKIDPYMAEASEAFVSMTTAGITVTAKWHFVVTAAPSWM